MRTYAQDTKVPIERSRAEIERMVAARGAGQFFSAVDHEKGTAQIGWTAGGRMVRLMIPLPPPPERHREQYERLCRARWRSVVLLVKAKFIAIDQGISSVEREFLADTVMSDGSTVHAWIRPQLESMYKGGKMPALLPGVGETK